MKKILYFTLISIISLCFNGCSKSYIATVNGVEITKDQYENAMNIIEATGNYVDNGYIKNLKENTEKKYKTDLKSVIISLLVENEVVYQQGKRLDLEPTKKEIDIKYEQLIKSMNDNKKYKSQMESVNIDKKYLLELIKKDITIENYKKAFQDNIQISEDEMLEYYNSNKEKFKVNEVRASHILISTLDKNNNEVSKEEKNMLKEKANNIKEEIKNGESFEALAKKYSDDRKSGKNGGDLGYFTKNEKNIEFTSKVFKLKEKEVSDAFETSYGYHIVKLTEKRNYVKEYSLCKEEVKQNILNEKYIEHVERLSKEAKIKS